MQGILSRPSERAEAEPYTCNAVVLAGSALLEAERILAGAGETGDDVCFNRGVWPTGYSWEIAERCLFASAPYHMALIEAIADALPELDRLASQAGLAVVVMHSESRTVRYLVDTSAPEAEQPAVVATFVLPIERN